MKYAAAAAAAAIPHPKAKNVHQLVHCPYLNWMVIELILMDCYLIHSILLKLMKVAAAAAAAAVGAAVVVVVAVAVVVVAGPSQPMALAV